MTETKIYLGWKAGGRCYVNPHLTLLGLGTVSTPERGLFARVLYHTQIFLRGVSVNAVLAHAKWKIPALSVCQQVGGVQMLAIACCAGVLLRQKICLVWLQISLLINVFLLVCLKGIMCADQDGEFLTQPR